MGFCVIFGCAAASLNCAKSYSPINASKNSKLKHFSLNSLIYMALSVIQLLPEIFLTLPQYAPTRPITMVSKFISGSEVYQAIPFPP